MKTLFVIDALNLLFRSYYAITSMTNEKGESTNALFGFIRSLYKLIHEFSPDHLIVVFDGPDNKKSRTAIYSEYKGHRKEMPQDLGPQIGRAEQFCTLAGIPYLSVPGVEADDTMGSIAKEMEKRGVNVVLCSGDKDLCQLVSKHIQVLNLHKDNLVMDREKVKEVFGVYPEQIVDYLALVGDASDNIPGIEGFGPKTVVALLNEYGTLDHLLQSLDQLSGKRKEALLNGQEIALLSRQLAMIQLDVDFPKEEDFFRLKAPQLDEIREFYKEMHFLSLLKGLGSSSQTAVSYHLVDEESVLHALVKKLSREPTLCVDTETTSVRPLEANLVGIGLGIAPSESWYIPCNGSLGKKKALSLLKSLLENPEIGWVGHNIKYDLQVLSQENIALSSIAFDTMLASYLVNPHIPRHGLDELSLEKFGKVKIPISDLLGKGKQEKTMQEVPLKEVATYCGEDVDYTLRLKALFEKELKICKVERVFNEIEIPLISVLARMERHGIFCDKKELLHLSKELKEKLSVLETKIYKFAKEEFNINSPKQLSYILFEKMGIKPPKKTTTGFSTAANVLDELKEESPLVQEIIEYRTLEKLRSTYVDALPQEINPSTGKIHCSFNQSVAATGRLSCQHPNLQNIPVRTEEGKKIRAAFKPQDPHYRFVSADYSQIELRLLAHLSEDPCLLQAFQNQEDVHSYTASLVFDIPLKEVTSEMRHRAKAVNFGILYGQQAFGLSQQLGISHEEASHFIKTYFKRYAKVEQFLSFCKESARKTGRAVTLTGRQRPLPEIHSKNPSIRAAAERLAVNTPLQGTAADLIKIAMIQIDAHLQKKPTLGAMILQIHDELLFESPDDKTASLAKLAKEVMEGVFTLKVPLVVDISIGKNWGAC